MAFSDFSVSNIQHVGSIIGGVSGQVAVNANLPNSNLLTLNGTNSRKFIANSTNVQYSEVLYPNSTTYPQFTGVPDTQAISLRMWVRKTLETGANNGGGFQSAVLAAKWTLNGMGVGYLLSYGGSPGAVLGGGTYEGLSLMVNGTQYNDLVVLPSDIWYYMRLDVIPVKNNGVVDRDTIRVYTSTLANEASPVWTLVTEKTVLLANGGISWGSGTVNGFGVAVTSDNGNVKNVYVDGFDIRTLNV